MTTEARRVMDVAISERDFMQQVIDLARMSGWLLWHDNATNARRRCPHCQTVIHQPRNAPGFPDLLLLRDEDLIVAECKAQRGRLSADQEHWLRAFAGVERVEALLVKPEGWEQFAAMLSRGSGRSA